MANTTTISKITWSAIILIHLALAIFIFIRLSQSQNLRLPIPKIPLALSILDPLLPIIAVLLPALAALGRSRTKRHDAGSALTIASEGRHHITPLARPVITVLSLIDVSLIASASTALSPSSLNCSLSSTWNLLFRAKDATAIRTIQDALHCCGFRTTHDQAYPFPDRSHDATACSTTFDRHVACQPKLEHATQQTLGAFVAVGAVALAIKAVLLLLTTRRVGLQTDGQPVWKRNEPRALLGDMNGEREGSEDTDGDGHGNEEPTQRGLHEGQGHV